jgi:hypothetical protein
MKECTKCKIEKESSEFSKDKDKKDGLTSNCKACNKKYRQDNAEQLKKYHQENAERINQYSKKYRQKNAEKIKKYHQENAEQSKKYSKKWRQENAEKIKKYRKKHRESLKDGFHHVYYLPNHNYVGTTDLIVERMSKHRSDHNRITDNYEILASFEDRDKALRFERLMHDSGFEGRHNNNSYK